MKTPTELKKEHQLSDEEITKQANKLIDNIIEPEIIKAIKDYKDETHIRLVKKPFTSDLVSIPIHKYDNPTPLGNHLVEQCIRILSDNGYDAYIDEDTLRITW